MLLLTHQLLLQIDDPLDAIAVHAFNGTWGVWAVGLFAGKNLVNTSYGFNPYTNGDRAYGCFMGGDGRLLAAQIVYSIWLGSEGFALDFQPSLAVADNPVVCVAWQPVLSSEHHHAAALRSHCSCCTPVNTLKFADAGTGSDCFDNQSCSLFCIF